MLGLLLVFPLAVSSAQFTWYREQEDRRCNENAPNLVNSIVVKSLQECKDECEDDEFCYHITHWLRVLPDKTEQICDLRSFGCVCSQTTEQKGATTHLLVRKEPKMVPIEGNKVCDPKLLDHRLLFDFMSTIECYNLCDKKRCKAATITGSVDNPYCEVFPKCDYVVDADKRSLTFTLYNPQVPYSPPTFRLCPEKPKDEEEREGNDAKAAERGNTEKKSFGEEKSAPNSGESDDRKKSSGEGKSGGSTDESAPAEKSSSDKTKSGENMKPADKQIGDLNGADKESAEKNADSSRAGENRAERNADSRQPGNGREERAAGGERRESETPMQDGKRYTKTLKPKPTEKSGNDQEDIMQALHTPITVILVTVALILLVVAGACLALGVLFLLTKTNHSGKMDQQGDEELDEVIIADPLEEAGLLADPEKELFSPGVTSPTGRVPGEDLLDDPLITPTLPEAEFLPDVDEAAPPLPEDTGSGDGEAEVAADPSDADANENGNDGNDAEDSADGPGEPTDATEEPIDAPEAAADLTEVPADSVEATQAPGESAN